MFQKEISSSAVIGIWEVTETKEELFSKLQWGIYDLDKYSSINNNQKSLEWLCSRVLIRVLLNTNDFIFLETDELGKPHLRNRQEKISISHSKNKAAVMIDTEKECGIDIQKILEKTMNLIPKFMNDSEQKDFYEKPNLTTIHKYWCGKEAIYKAYGRRKIQFKENVHLEKLNASFPSSSKGYVHTQNEKIEYDINFDIYEEFVMAWV